MSNLYHQLPQNLEEEVFEVLVTSKSVRIERIVSLGHTTPSGEWYDQAQNEWVVLLQGAAMLAFETGESLRLAPGDYVHLPAHKKHRVEWTEEQGPTIWLAIHY